MDKVICNASPLIYLAKADAITILKAVVGEVLIPSAVYDEVVVKGKELGQVDAFRVERAVKQGWIIVHKVAEMYAVEIPLHPGEVEVISLAKQIGVSTVLMDDLKARAACELAGLKPIGTVGILLMALRENYFDFDGFLRTLQDIVKSGLYLKEDVYLTAVREAIRMTAGK